MKRKRVNYSPIFFKALKNFPKTQLKFLAKKEQIFLEDPFDPRLKTHKLKGSLAGHYSFSISYHWRIVFHFEDEETIIFDTIGTHAVYR